MITIQLEEIELQGRSIWEIATYPGIGMYLVNDGIHDNIVSVTDVIWSIPILQTVTKERIEQKVVEDVKTVLNDFLNKLPYGKPKTKKKPI